MKTIFWKELRETVKWGALALLLFALALAYGWSTLKSAGGSDSSAGLLAGVFMIITLLGPAVIGGALGLLQIVPEKARDRWAFLVHRPVPQASIFWGKTCAGLLLCLLATFPAFFVLACWASWPGHLAAPFEWRMILPGIANILCGAIFYFAGLLTALRGGRWWGSRALPIPAALLALGAVSVIPGFGFALAWICCCLAAFAIAARAAFLSNGVYKLQNSPGRCAIFAVNLLGTSAVVFVAIFAASMMLPGRTFTGDSQPQYMVLKDGTPIVQWINSGSRESVSTLDGKPVPLAQKQIDNIYNETLPEIGMSFEPVRGTENYREFVTYFRPLGNTGNDQWFFVRSRARYEAYDRVSSRRIGLIGQNGFFGEKDKAALQPFTGGLVQPFWNPYEQTDGRTPIFGANAYSVSLQDRTVTKLQPGSGSHPVHAAYLPVRRDDSAENGKRVAISLADRSMAVCETINGSLVLTIPAAAPEYKRVELSALPDGSAYYLFRYPGNLWALDSRLPVKFEQYDARGALVASVSLPISRRRPMSESLTSILEGAVMLPAVAVSVFGAGLREGFVTVDQLSSPEALHSLFAMAVGSAVAALLGLVRMRGQQMSLRARAIWAISILLTGVPGLLAFIATREMTTRVECPSCKSLRLVDHDTCPKCSSAWPAPKADGSEIFSAPEKDLAAMI